MENLDINKVSVGAFLKATNKGQSVKRCLFGPVDHKQNTEFLKKQLEMQYEEGRNKWNFDFKTMTPLSGKFQWMEVGENATNVIPPVYAKMPSCTRSRPRTPLGLISTSANSNSNTVTASVPIATPAVSRITKRLNFDVCCTSTKKDIHCTSTSSDSSRISEAVPTHNTEAVTVKASQSSQKSSSVPCIKTVPSSSKKRKLQQSVIPGKDFTSFFVFYVRIRHNENTCVYMFAACMRLSSHQYIFMTKASKTATALVVRTSCQSEHVWSGPIADKWAWG